MRPGLPSGRGGGAPRAGSRRLGEGFREPGVQSGASRLRGGGVERERQVARRSRVLEKPEEVPLDRANDFRRLRLQDSGDEMEMILGAIQGQVDEQGQQGCGSAMQPEVRRTKVDTKSE